MSAKQLAEYERLADLAESPDQPRRAPSPDTTYRTDTEVDPELWAMFRAAAEERDADPRLVAYVRSLGGRPSVDSDHAAGPSPLWSVRVSKTLDQRTRHRAAFEGRPMTQIVRQAVAEYLDRAGAA
ncbi:MAG: ribbon-helix-helix domain-containing protein [Bifidobacteriaceae bacterium]|jgi:hypothetical protein|nr:ribbon-helix-helix domain-containing protein [Bifidobacteriaceae bacterium]